MPTIGWSTNMFAPAATRYFLLSSRAMPPEFLGDGAVVDALRSEPVTRVASVIAALAARSRVTGFTPVETAKTRSVPAASAAALLGFNETTAAITTDRMNSARPDLENVRGVTNAHATAVAIASQDGPFLAANMSTAA